MSDPISFVDEQLGRFRTELYDFLRIPSVSTDHEHEGSVRAAAEWLAARLKEAGLESEVFDTPG
ncbi:MAG: hypothetical protein PVH96_01370, partial [Gemmatimonadota bacterium]